ncbi:MAG: hypothetical protein ACRCW9_06320 [Cetobacterium sp.]
MLIDIFKKQKPIKYKVTYVNEEIELDQEQLLDFFNHCNEEGTYGNITKIEGVKND